MNRMRVSACVHACQRRVRSRWCYIEAKEVESGNANMMPYGVRCEYAQ